MPSALTITAFYTFSANTKARAGQANTNFSNFRGHMLPINPNTAAAADNSYDLGSEEYRWRTGYYYSLDLSGATSTADMQIVPDTSTNTGDVWFQFLTTTARVARIDTRGIDPHNSFSLVSTITGSLSKVITASSTGSFTITTIQVTPKYSASSILFVPFSTSGSFQINFNNQTSGTVNISSDGLFFYKDGGTLTSSIGQWLFTNTLNNGEDWAFPFAPVALDHNVGTTGAITYEISIRKLGAAADYTLSYSGGWKAIEIR